MDTANNQEFFAEFEKNRLIIEDHVLHLPESSYLLTQYKNRLSIDAEAYLHAIPIASALFKIYFYSSRTADKINSHIAACSAYRPFDPQQSGYVLTCFAFAHLYRKIYKITDSQEFAKQLSTILCLSNFNYASLQHIDWAVKALAESRKPGLNNWLAPAQLFSVWTIRTESEVIARSIIDFLNKVFDYVDCVWEAALKNQVYMNLPW